MIITVNGIEYRLSRHQGLNDTVVYVYTVSTNELVGCCHIDDNTETAYVDTEDGDVTVSYHEFADIDLQDRGVAMATWFCGTL